MTTRQIAVLTGKRGGYGAMKPMLKLMEADPALKLSLIVTDQHVNPKFGATIGEVEKEFKVAAAVDMEQRNGSGHARARAIGVCLSKMTEVLDEMRPHILVLYGDRGEVIATAIAAIHLGIPIAHLQGGDLREHGRIDSPCHDQFSPPPFRLQPGKRHPHPEDGGRALAGSRGGGQPHRSNRSRRLY